jgi:hypothetical protein
VDGRGDLCEIRVRDTGIGIAPENHIIIFEKLYQIGKVELHSSGRIKFKGGGPGLGLAISAASSKPTRERSGSKARATMKRNYREAPSSFRSLWQSKFKTSKIL